MGSAPSISAIVPMLNEAPRIRAHLAALRAAHPHEVIVVDGGSTDESCALAEGHCDLLLREPGGLAAQLNRGARAATGETLFFPYADTTLPARWDETIARILGDDGVAGGAFRLALDSPRLRYRAIACGANLRNRLGLGPFGDQAIFVRRAAFDDAGGVRSGVLLEDLDLVQRLRRMGRFVIARECVRTAVRRWEEQGILRTALRNAAFLAAYLAGLRGPAHERRYLAHRQTGRAADRRSLAGQPETARSPYREP